MALWSVCWKLVKFVPYSKYVILIYVLVPHLHHRLCLVGVYQRTRGEIAGAILRSDTRDRSSVLGTRRAAGGRGGSAGER